MNKKLNKLYDELYLSKKISIEFGFLYGINEFISGLVFRDRGYFGKKCHKYQYDAVKKYLVNSKFLNCYDSNSSSNDKCNIKEDSPIWILWWQGIENAPEIVKKSVESIKKHKGNHSIIILTKDNIRNYVDIPNYIYDKLKSKKITITHFSDILRCCILYQHGGIWMDATLYMTDDFNPSIYKHCFYTIHHNKRANYHICKGKWTGFFMASAKGNSLMKYMSDCLLKYWLEHDTLICYLLIDCFLAIGYENISAIRKIIDSVEINNMEVLKLATLFNEKYNEEECNSLLKNTYMHKLSYKVKTTKRKNTVYWHITNLDSFGN